MRANAGPTENRKPVDDVTSPAPPVHFAPSDEVAKYGDISSEFFRLIGLGEVWFISNESRLSDFDGKVPELTPQHLHERIRELYGVDVSDVDLLTEIFERIKRGPVYRGWKASQG